MASLDVAIAGERVANDKTVAEHCESAVGKCVVVVARGLSKMELAEQVSDALEGVDPGDIISVAYHADWVFFPLWRRNSALIVICPSGDG